jgi:hypothetical protein
MLSLCPARRGAVPNYSDFTDLYGEELTRDYSADVPQRGAGTPESDA